MFRPLVRAFRHVRACSVSSQPQRLIGSISADDITMYPISSEGLVANPYIASSRAGSMDEIEVQFLGTSSASATQTRNVSSIAMTFPNSTTWVFDAGEGVTSRFQRTNAVRFVNIKKIFISHLHSDHCLGLPNLLVSIGANTASEDILEIYGPLGLSDYVRAALHFTRPKTLKNLRFYEFIPWGIPASALPLDALFYNNQPEKQKCQNLEKKRLSHNKTSFFFSDLTTDLSKYYPLENANLGLLNTGVERHSSIRRHRQYHHASFSEPIKINTDNGTIHAVLGLHSTHSWGFIFEEESFKKLQVNSDLPPGRYMKYMKHGHLVAVPKTYPTLFTVGRNTELASTLPSMGEGFSTAEQVQDHPIVAKYTMPKKGTHTSFLCFDNILQEEDDGNSDIQKFPSDFPEELISHFTLIDPRSRVKLQKGRKVVLLFDCAGGDKMSKPAQEQCKDADILVHESTFFCHAPSVVREARTKMHSTSRIAGQFAHSVGCRNLILNHFSPKYKDDQLIGISADKVVQRSLDGGIVVSNVNRGDYLVPYMNEMLLSSGGHLLEAGKEVGLVAQAEEAYALPSLTSEVADCVEGNNNDVETYVSVEELRELPGVQEFRNKSIVTGDNSSRTMTVLTAHDYMLLKLVRDRTLVEVQDRVELKEAKLNAAELAERDRQAADAVLRELISNDLESDQESE